MKATNAFSLLLTLLLSACYVDVYETGKSSSSYYTYSSDSYNSSSSQEVVPQPDSIRCGEHSYKTIIMKKTSSQTWIAQNLNEIPKVGTSWCYGNFDENCNIRRYGRLYDWAAAMSICSACEGDWKLPSKDDFDDLSDWDGDLLRATSVWDAVFAGFRYEDESRGPFAFQGSYGYWWASTNSGDMAYSAKLASGGIKLDREWAKKAMGYSVRCIKK